MTAVAEETPVITQAGIYDGLDEAVYHADPVLGGSLSVSGAKKLLPPSVPAKFDYERKHPSPPTKAMERGTAAHMLVLGTGPEIVVVKAKDWRTDAAKLAAKNARAAGKVPLLPHEHEQVQAMAAAIRAHPVASAVFDPARGGHAEQSMFWFDERWGVWRRCRMDWLPALDGRRPILADYKTAASAEPRAFAKAVANFRYDMQADWYAEAVEALTGQRLPFIFVVQEKEPPYLVATYQLDADAEATGRLSNQRALEIYRDSEESGVWLGYSREIEQLSLPRWAQVREEY